MEKTRLQEVDRAVYTLVVKKGAVKPREVIVFLQGEDKDLTDMDVRRSVWRLLARRKLDILKGSRLVARPSTK